MGGRSRHAPTPCVAGPSFTARATPLCHRGAHGGTVRVLPSAPGTRQEEGHRESAHDLSRA
eukprot:gene21379-38793_t